MRVFTVRACAHDLIMQGWGWGREAGGVSNNHVIANKIESVLSERCCDGEDVRAPARLGLMKSACHESPAGVRCVYEQTWKIALFLTTLFLVP